MRPSLSDLDGAAFDTLVIGGGINGASAAQQLAAAGYRVLLVEKGDFASGASSRSSRLLHCGLRFFETPNPVLDFTLAPGKLWTSLVMARQSMEMRAELVRTSAARLRPFTMLFPVHSDGPYRGWQVDLALRLLRRFGQRGAASGSDAPLNDRRLRAAAAQHVPFVSDMRDQDRLLSVATFTEYLFDWPERFTLDAVLDARRMGAVVLNHTAATGLQHRGDWHVSLADAQAKATVTAGIWIDRVSDSAGRDGRLIYGTKGAHIVVQLPPAYRNHGVSTINSLGEPHYCVPSQGGLHHIGPTETPYDGDPDDIRVTPDERRFLLDETRRALPGLGLTEDDVLYTWAGVRPLGFDPAYPKGKRSADIHDQGQGLFALTGGPIMTHRALGRKLRDSVAGMVRPPNPPQTPDYAPRLPPENPNSPAFDDQTHLSDLAHVATEEMATSLSEILIARTGAVYRQRLTDVDLRTAAQAVSAHLGWDTNRIEAEVQATRAHLAHLFGMTP